MVIGTINNSQFTDVSCLSFHVQAFLSFFLLFSSDHEYLYCRMKTRRLYSFFISCLQFRCLISYALNFNAFLHRGIQNIYISAAQFFVNTFSRYSLQFIPRWMIYPVNKLLGCVCSCAQFFSPLLKLLKLFCSGNTYISRGKKSIQREELARNRSSLVLKKHLMNCSLQQNMKCSKLCPRNFKCSSIDVLVDKVTFLARNETEKFGKHIEL